MFKHDLHVHTNLSLCAYPDATIENYLPVIQRLGIKHFGLTDHFWDSKIPGSSDWYAPQNWEHVKPLKQHLREIDIPEGVKLYFGCETEYVGYGIMAVDEETASNFEYILVPPDHFHMTGLTRPEGLKDIYWLRKLTLDRFHECCDLPLCWGIAHPFSLLLFYKDSEEAVLSGITDEQYAEAFRHAAANKKHVELNLCILRGMGPKDEDGFPAEQVRCYTIAREAGCRFYFATDSHSGQYYPDETLAQMEKFVAKCGITLADNPLEE